MVETIELSAPVLIDGVRVRELTYDFDEVTPEQFIEAELSAANKATMLNKFSAKVVEIDAGFHYYLGVMAIIAANPEYSIEDVERVKGPDIMKVMRIGRNFTTAGAEGDEDEGEAPEQPAEEPEEEGPTPDPE